MVGSANITEKAEDSDIFYMNKIFGKGVGRSNTHLPITCEENTIVAMIIKIPQL